MVNSDRDKVLLFTDGACKGNPGRGGWGYLFVTSKGHVQEGGGAQKKATNNQMELLAVIMGLESLLGVSDSVVVLTDSTYVIKGIQSWIKNWLKNSWQTKAGKPVANRNLWIRLWEASQKMKVTWQHVRGHAGIPGNERVDDIASSFALGNDFVLFKGHLDQYSLDPYHLEGTKKQGESKESQAKVSSQSSRKRPLVYLSYIDGALSEHRTWSECEARVKGRAGAKFKKAFSSADIDIIKKSWGLV